MNQKNTPLFLEAQGYRRRRLLDAARLFPILGAALLMIPLLWPKPSEPLSDPAAGEAVPMSSAFLYVYASWMLLILLSAIFGLWARTPSEMDGPHGPRGG